ncbi:hypothetical protein HPB50_010397 [Hyalomma asiaticum]|uniref:Uncharacterized protein n=1 Tax=Hyalomma asiaticum TaxID=266040 RepID=A0ACB7S689_HYAAI|nr:hypothetical protein HPB50_010397 [Hyalomma asiaticum]
MAELKYVQYLLEEEKLILQSIGTLQEQANKLRVEEMNILSALRGLHDAAAQDEETLAVDLKNAEVMDVTEEHEELTNSQAIDLRVDNILNKPMDFPSAEQDVVEEDEDEPESKFTVLKNFMQ